MKTRFYLSLVCCWLLAGCGFMQEGLTSGSVLFEEQFTQGETGNWQLEADPAGQTFVASEQLHIQLITPNTAQYAAVPEQFFEDMVVEVTATQLEGSQIDSYGLLFRLQSNSEFYRFEMSSDGHFLVEKRLPAGGWQRLTNGWQLSSAIKKGHNQENRLKIEAIGPNFRFFINDQLVFQATDASYGRGQIALSANTFSQGNLLVAFDNVSVKQP